MRNDTGKAYLTGAFVSGGQMYITPTDAAVAIFEPEPTMDSYWLETDQSLTVADLMAKGTKLENCRIVLNHSS